ncbi:MAG: hypothetical protein RL553_578 [Planctomycetota bacterium]|jgi:hypothetical protein
MIKLHVSACKKITDGNYGSRGGTVGIEIEVDSSLVGDSAKLQAHIRHLFELARRSLTEELQASNEPASIENSHHHDGANLNGNGASNAVSVAPTRFATEKQILCIQGLARKHGIPVPELLKQAGVRVFNDMSVRQASQMIESLKAGGAN